VPWALQGERPQGRVLEVGAGGGAMAVQILAAHPLAALTATDVDPAMVARARRALAPFGARASAEVADATALPFADGSFDAALSFLMLHHVPRRDRALAELVRVLRPGGRLLAYDLLASPAARLAHVVSRSAGVRLVGRYEVAALADGLALRDVRVRTTAGQLFRLSAYAPTEAMASTASAK
jgi:ubiquinone/menaquinone biosynthesis C-methylase UbiE